MELSRKINEENEKPSRKAVW